MKRIAIGIIAAGIALGGLVWIARSDSRSATASRDRTSGTLTAEGADRHDFGTISMAAGNVQHQFTIRNTSDETVTIENVTTSCMCTTASLRDSSGRTYGAFGMPGHGTSPKTNIRVAPGESVTVDAVFDPAAHGPSGTGLAQRSIYLETNSAASPTIELAFQAVVTR